MTPEQKQQRIEQIRERGEKYRRLPVRYEYPELPTWKDIDVLLSLVKSQEAQLSEEILKTLDDAVIRVGCSANCYDSPADANSGAEYVAMRVRQIVAPSGEANSATTPNAKVERFYFLDSHGDTAFVREADYEHAATCMRSACVEKVRAQRDLWTSKLDETGDLLWNAWVDAANKIIEALESVSIQEQEAKQS